MRRTKAIRVRKTWGGLNPVTRVKPSAKIYSRKKRINSFVSNE